MFQELTAQITYKKTKGFADGRGLEYEIKIATLLFLRALRLTQHFYIATNMADAGAFDDVVIVYKLEGSEQWKSCFIQLKHRTSEKKINMQKLLNFTGNGDFSLGKYSQSYTKIKKRFEAGDSEDPVFGGNFRDSECVIYTNATMDDQLCSRERQTHSNILPLLQTNEEPGSVFSFSETSDQDIYGYFNELLKVKEFLRSQKFASISDEEFHTAIEQFKTSLISKLPEMIESNFRKERMEKMRSALHDLEDYSDFLRNMSFFIKQLNEKEMENILLKEIQNIFCTKDNDSESIRKELYDAVSHWWREEDYYLTETTPFWQEIIKSRLKELSQRKCNEMNELGLAFQNISFQLNINRPILELNIVTKLPLLTCSKVCQSLDTPHIVMGLQSILTLKREVLALWPSKWCTTLVVECEQVEQSVEFLCFQQPQHRLIIVSRKPVQCDEHVTDVTKFSDFDERSQRMIGEREITFQGYQVKIKSLLTHEEMHSINEDVLLQILASNEVTVGKIIRTEKIEYISRNLSHCIYVKETFLNTNKQRDVVAISGVVKENISLLSSGNDVCIAILTSDNSCKYFAIDVNNYDNITTQGKERNGNVKTEKEVDPNLCRFTIIRNSTEFNRLCEKFQNVHWFELQTDKKLMWKISKRDISDIQKYIDKTESVSYDQEQMLTIADRIILIIAEPGMGKSTLASQISTGLKQIHPSKWVILVTLNDCTHLLHKYENKEISIEFVIEILAHAADVNDSELGKFLFASGMKHMANVVVLLDGIDEISPDYTNLVLSFTKKILKMGVSQIWITSRPLQTNVLEKELCVLPYTLLPFTVDNQVSFLENYWTTNNSQIDSSVKKEFASRLIQINTHNLSERESQFMGIPLQVRMMAEMFEHDLKTFNEKGDVALPENINLTGMFKKFVQFKYDFFNEKKKKIDLSNVNVKSTFGKFYEQYDQEHALCSLAILLPESDKCILRPKEIWHDINDVVNNIESEIFRIGIIDGVMSNMPQFIHRSFAEYFFALWIMGNYKQNKQFLSRSLCQHEFHVMWRMLNYMICESSDLHMAVLNNDKKQVKELLENKINVDKEDEYGRTALHLASYYNHRNIAEELLNNGADIYKRDFLTYRSLDYAESNNAWATADLLLYHCKNAKRRLLFRRDELSLLRDKITDSNYGISALLESAQNGYTELTSYLHCNGLDIMNIILNSKMQTALHIAVLNEQHGIIDLLLDILSHRENKKWKWIRKLFPTEDTSKDNIFNKKDIYENTALMYAAEKRDSLLTKKLLLHAANVNAQNVYHETALHNATLVGHFPTVECLLRHGADMNITDNSGRTPLDLAVLYGHLPIVKHMLAGNEALLTISNSFGATPIHYAAYNGHTSVVEYLIERNIGIDVRTEHGDTPLHYATRRGHLATVECLLRHGADMNITNNYGSTPLHLAAESGHLPIVKHLVVGYEALLTITDTYGDIALNTAAYNGQTSVVEYLSEGNTRVDVHNKNGNTALHYAAELGHLPILECLLRHGADMNITNNYGSTPLHLAAESGHLPIVKHLVVGYEALLTITDTYGDIALNTAAYNGQTSVVEYLSEGNTRVDVHNKNGNTALHYAAVLGHLPILECLLRHGADMNITNNYGSTPLHLAAESGHLPIVKHLVVGYEALLTITDTYGDIALNTAAYNGQTSVVEYLSEGNTRVDVHNKNGNTALHYAAELGHLPILECLLRHGADMNITNNYGSTPLHLAAFSGHLPIVKLLLVENEALLTVADSDGDTALHNAAFHGHTSVVEYLSERNIEIDECNEEGNTALHYAAEQGHLPSVECLLRHGADMKITNNNGRTPLHLAALSGHLPIVKRLSVGNEALLTTADSDGDTALHGAAYYGHSSVAEYLSERNIEIDIRNEEGNTALHYAAERGHLPTVECLLRHGAYINVTDNNGRTSMHLAAISGHFTIVKYLVENEEYFLNLNSECDTIPCISV
ncbi:hypothetical protein ANN_08780 [Periplaneta americana]|uniref:NACHT domain-containing protein n=1 Tax=Periplaneta americana TaxID=6978 RepID=A0ABQ8T326_PERAM|nr:hypothetical protein ANN_08780 [Periplaneta americana]